ncbi:MAG: hypothetical protein MUF34_34915, partial [Polyangiaceae bacterium]|nr:hypothetical protein [Polyangiaceae bacterium]
MDEPFMRPLLGEVGERRGEQVVVQKRELVAGEAGAARVKRRRVARPGRAVPGRVEGHPDGAVVAVDAQARLGRPRDARLEEKDAP